MLYDSFNYASGDLPGEGSWTNSGAGTPPQVQGGNLSYSGLPASSGSELVLNGGGANAFHMLSSTVTNGSVYCSFLLELSGPPSWSTFASFGNSSSPAWQLGFYQLFAGATNLMLYDGNIFQIPDSSTLNFASTYFVVGSYNFVPGTDNDSVSLWLNPSASTFGNATSPAPSITLSCTWTADPVSSIDRFTWLNSSPNVLVDELRVGTTWADVTSSIPEPGAWSIAAGFLTFFALRRLVRVGDR